MENQLEADAGLADLQQGGGTPDGELPTSEPPGNCGCPEKSVSSGEEPDDEAAAADVFEKAEGLAAFTDQTELDAAIGILTQIALQMDDPVQALEDGTDALAEALVRREQEAQHQKQQAEAQHQQHQAASVELRRAYEHARLHRVGELVDVGYGLDQAIAVTHANEMEIRQRAAAAGRNPDAVIYEYAVRHGFRPTPSRNDTTRSHGSRQPRAAAGRPAMAALERLATLSDEEFATATRGDRWERLLKG